MKCVRRSGRSFRNFAHASSLTMGSCMSAATPERLLPTRPTHDKSFALQGIRVYQHGATLATHLDWADQWVVSATLNIRQAPGNASIEWPVVVRGLDGAAHTVVHGQGEAMLYEGSRLLHGRPFPYAGEEYAALFVGFVPKRYPQAAGLSTRIAVNTVRTVKHTVLRIARALRPWLG
jgi:hypothetical protein